MIKKENKSKDRDFSTLLNSVSCIGVIKPSFDPVAQNFLPPQLNVLGTGFWVDNGIFVTCAHVVANIITGPLEMVGMLVVGGNGNQYLKTIISIIDYEHDLAILKVSGSQFHLEQKERCVSVNKKKEKIGDEVFFAGYPLGNLLLNEQHTPILNKAIISHTSSSINKIRKEIKLSGFVEGGFSGSPVVDENDNVIGVVSNSIGGTKNIFNIISWEHILKLIELENS